MMHALTDIHQHLLWGFDDGPKTPEVMHAMLREAHDQAIRRIIATSHAYPGYHPFGMALYQERLSEAQDYCRERDWEISIMPGAEIAWTYNTVEALRRKQVPTLNQTDYVLIELWKNISWAEVKSAVQQLLRAGYLPILAHVERYRCFVWNPDKAIQLKEELPVCYQLDADPLIGDTGPILRRFISRMLNERAIDAVASDAHNCTSRPQRLAQAYQALSQRCDADYTDALFHFDEVMK